MSLPNYALPERILSRLVITESGCWEWTGRNDGRGYGQVWWDGRYVRAHRLVTHLVHGLDMADRSTVARHKCDNPPCVNPDHLEPGTAADNARDSVERGRRNRKICRAKLHPMTDDNILWRGGKRHCLPCRTAREQQAKEERRVYRSANPFVPTGAPKGLANGMGRFSDDEIAEMRLAHASGESCRAIGRRLGADSSYVWRIVNGKRRAS